MKSLDMIFAAAWRLASGPGGAQSAGVQPAAIKRRVGTEPVRGAVHE